MKSAKSRFQKPRESIAFRPPQPLREKLEQSAEAAGHSLSFEITTRLQEAYSYREWARDQLADAFGDYETMAIVFTIARAVQAVSQRRRAHWLADDKAWAEAKECIDIILGKFAPYTSGQWTPSPGRRAEWETYTASDQYSAAGKFTANELLSLIAEGGADWWPFGDTGSDRRTTELQRDIIDRDELLHALQALLRQREGTPPEKGKKRSG